MHLAAEATVVAVGMLSDVDYNARAVLALPHCKNGTASDQYQLISSMLSWWWAKGGPHEKYGPLMCLSSDGATIRRQPLHDLFETNLLSSTSQLHGIVSQLPLLDLHVARLGDMCVNYDDKHLGKRLRTSVVSPTRGIMIMGQLLTK
jgi:hypothetical protein